jgi:hypothetical protein
VTAGGTTGAGPGPFFELRKTARNINNPTVARIINTTAPVFSSTTFFMMTSAVVAI